MKNVFVLAALLLATFSQAQATECVKSSYSCYCPEVRTTEDGHTYGVTSPVGDGIVACANSDELAAFRADCHNRNGEGNCTSARH